MSRKQEDLIREVMKQKQKEIAELRELYFSLLTKRIESEQQLIERDRESEVAIPSIPTKDSVAFSEPVKELQTYKGRLVNPDVYKVVDGKLYFKKPHENCGGDILVIECRGGWDHGHAKCTKCGKTLGGWISGADNMPFYG